MPLTTAFFMLALAANPDARGDADSNTAQPRRKPAPVPMVMPTKAVPCPCGDAGYIPPQYGERPPGWGCLNGYHDCLHAYPAFQEAQYRRGFNYRVITDYPWSSQSWGFYRPLDVCPAPLMYVDDSGEEIAPGTTDRAPYLARPAAAPIRKNLLHSPLPENCYPPPATRIITIR